MQARLAACVGKQVLLADIGNVRTFLALREQVVEGLVFAGTEIFRNLLIPLLGVVEFRIYVKDYAAKGVDSVPDHLAKPEFRPNLQQLLHDRVPTPAPTGTELPVVYQMGSGPYMFKPGLTGKCFADELETVLTKKHLVVDEHRGDSE